MNQATGWIGIFVLFANSISMAAAEAPKTIASVKTEAVFQKPGTSEYKKYAIQVQLEENQTLRLKLFEYEYPELILNHEKEIALTLHTFDLLRQKIRLLSRVEIKENRPSGLLCPGVVHIADEVLWLEHRGTLKPVLADACRNGRTEVKPESLEGEAKAIYEVLRALALQFVQPQ